MQVCHSTRDIDGEAEPKPPAEVEVLIDDVRAQIAVWEVLGDNEDASAGSRRLGLNPTRVVEGQGR